VFILFLATEDIEKKKFSPLCAIADGKNVRLCPPASVTLRGSQREVVWSGVLRGFGEVFPE